jgi:hypothetical protein
MSQPYAPQAQQFPATAGAPQVRCRFCGCVPAVQTKFRGHQGMIILMRFLSLDGPFCRDCGLSTFRDMTTKTLWQGWYGYGSMIITPITVLMNLFRRGKVAKLPAPQRAADGSGGTPMNPGKPLLARPAALIGICIPFLLIALFVLIITINAINSGEV